MTAKILIVEDDELNREVLEAYLLLEEYQVILTHSGTKGLELVTKEMPDLVILDVNLPDMSGYEICQQIKERQLSPAVVFVTGLSLKEDRQQAMEAGADDFISRPFDGTDFLHRIQQALISKAI